MPAVSFACGVGCIWGRSLVVVIKYRGGKVEKGGLVKLGDVDTGIGGFVGGWLVWAGVCKKLWKFEVGEREVWCRSIEFIDVSV